MPIIAINLPQIKHLKNVVTMEERAVTFAEDVYELT